MAFHENLLYLRKKAKMTQEDLAEALDVSRQSVSKWETGDAYPETEKLIAICDKFGVTMDELVRGDFTVQSAAERFEQVPQETAAASGEISQADKKLRKKAAVFSAISSGIFLCSLIVFLAFGFSGYWYISWVSFLYGFALGSAVHAFFGGAGEDEAGRTKFQHISASLSGAVMFLCVAVYLTLGMTLSLWHPAWIIFIVGAVICVVLGVLSGDDFRKDKDEKDGER